ncbi:LOW QUALITY PROTEIN: hypothetical protein TorRG33x02_126370 [Trema orientale]|uniref:Uncharacterized protein n=1 Tax=Trema orientale TaxID=63057 RepID=A0A2P5F1D4_TREOI|nr:LOW QUALITY PROTEIN: hypothetical protein TorRG33x02_126370 [Trema orientale]
MPLVILSCGFIRTLFSSNRLKLASRETTAFWDRLLLEFSTVAASSTLLISNALLPRFNWFCSLFVKLDGPEEKHRDCPSPALPRQSATATKLSNCHIFAQPN